MKNNPDDSAYMATFYLYLIAIYSIAVSIIPVLGDDKIDAGIQIRQGEPNHVIAQKNGQLMLNCSVTLTDSDQGPLEYTWTKDGEPIEDHIQLQNNGSLYFRRVIHKPRKNKTDMGFYECYVKNKIGSIIARRVNVDIARLSGSPIDVQDDQGYVLKTLGKEDVSIIIEDYVDSYPARQWTPPLEVGPWNKCKDVDETINLGFKKIHIKFKACITVEVLPNGIKVTLSAGRLTYSETITVPNPKPICHKLPGLEIVDICLALYNLNFKELSGCARIDISVKIKTFKIDLGCFKLKQVQEEPVQRADTLSDNNLLLFEPVEEKHSPETYGH